MTPLKLIYFCGCPHVEKVKNLLKAAGAAYLEIRREALPEKHRLTGYTSPTVLAEERIIIGAKTKNAAGCSIDIPSIDELKRRLASNEFSL